MNWLPLAALFASTAALGVAFCMWLRVRRVEQSIKKDRTSKGPPGAVPVGFETMELSLEAMLEELESKGQEIIRKIDRREREFRDSVMVSDARRSADTSGPEPEKPPKGSGGKWTEKAEVVRRLADEGHDVTTIAQRLGLGKGEVQLIMESHRPAR